MTKTNEQERPLTYSMKEAAELLGVSKGTVYLACRDGQFPAIRVRKTWRIPSRALWEMIEQACKTGAHGGEAA